MGVRIPDDWPRGLDEPDQDVPALRRVTLTPASSIQVRPVRWLWNKRMPLGSLTLLGGREGIGKSPVGYTLTADVTRGRLPGEHEHTAKAVIVAATEDSWAHTIVPRLMAADADLDRVYRVGVTTYDGAETSVSLPRDDRRPCDVQSDVAPVRLERPGLDGLLDR